MAWTTPRDWTAGEFVTEAIMDTHIRDNFNTVFHGIAKSADQSVTSSTVLVDDTHLQFAIGANESWAFRFILGVTLGATGTGKVALNAPASATGWWALVVQGGSGSMFQTPNLAATFVDGETQVFSTVNTVATIDGYCLNSSSAGTFKLRFAQQVSNGTPIVFKKGSFVETWRIT